jgi:hypothetical protein
MEIECDSCPATTDTFDKNDFSTMIACAKDDGWEIKPDDRCKGGYSHTCPDCRGGSSRLERAKNLLG